MGKFGDEPYMGLAQTLIRSPRVRKQIALAFGGEEFRPTKNYVLFRDRVVKVAEQQSLSEHCVLTAAIKLATVLRQPPKPKVKDSMDEWEEGE